MKFYTSVNRYMNQILYRGYDEGRRVKQKIKFKPTLYIKSKGTSEFKTLDDISVDPIKFDSMSEAKQFIDKYDTVENFQIYGNKNQIAQFIASEFLNEIEFNLNWIRIVNIDIETPSEHGFPDPIEVKAPIASIALHDSVSKTYYVWALGDYDIEARDKKLQDCTIRYIKCESEKTLLLGFLKYWSDEFTCPDIITGWNIRGFDIPYLVNRINLILGEEYVKKLSPWGIVEEKTVTLRKGTQAQIYDLIGIAQLDYMDVFQKFGNSFGPQENYRLDTIGNVVLGENKMVYEGSLSDLFKNNHQKAIDYNIRDVWLVDRMEDKIALIELCLTMAYKAGVNYSDAFGTTAIWDQLIHRTLLRQNIVIPQALKNFKTEYEGAYVKPPQCGVHDWVCSFDINSLYPNIIVQWNMSPETIMTGIVDSKVNINSLLSGYVSEQAKFFNASVDANGRMFSNKKQGFLPKIIEEMYSERVSIKRKMLDSKQEYELCDKNNKDIVYKIEKDIAHYDNQQTAIKLFLNSLYGAMGTQYFRYFKIEIAEGITATGQYIIKLAENNTNSYLNKLLNSNKDYVIAIDTDSLFIDFNDVVKSVYTEYSDFNKITNFLDKVCNKFETDIYDNLFKTVTINTNGFKQRISIKRESISNRGIWTAKKRYILNVIDNEGVRYSKPKLKITGIEAIKSSTPFACRVAFKKLFNILINENEEATQKFIANFKNEFYNLSAEEKAFPRGVTNVVKYVDKKKIFKEGTPMNSRAAILYNYMLKKTNTTNKYQEIGNGEKIKYIYLNPRNPLRQNVIGFFDVLPQEFNLHQYIDNELQFEKTFLKPANAILHAIGWEAEQTSSLDDFFS